MLYRGRLLPTRKDTLCILELCCGEAYESDIECFFNKLYNGKYELKNALEYLIRERLVVKKGNLYRLTDKRPPLEERILEVRKNLEIKCVII